jgi:hypothetical protein
MAQVNVAYCASHGSFLASSVSTLGADTLERRTAPGTAFDSGNKYNPLKCHPLARTAIFLMIKSWLHDERRDCGMLWMYGPNSVGKSSIAQTISHICANEGLLAASFFFSRSVAGLNTSWPPSCTKDPYRSPKLDATSPRLLRAIPPSSATPLKLHFGLNPLLQAYSTLSDKRTGKK